MPKLIMLVGPPGSGKSTHAYEYEKQGFVRVSQDDSGKQGHMEIFNRAYEQHKDIVIDRMGFSMEQRQRYISPIRFLVSVKYEIEIIVLHENYETCFARCMKREGHPTIKDEANAKSALNTFFSKYERVQDNEADVVTRIWPEGDKDRVVICDLDGTLCNIDHRLHFVRKVEGKKPDWKNFFYNIPGDSVNEWCAEIVLNMLPEVIFCSGRPDNYRGATEDWLSDNGFSFTNKLFMRNRHDSRKDSIVKEIILDFEILTRWKPLFAIDDRDRVVKMWRSRDIVCLQCHEGNF